MTLNKLILTQNDCYKAAEHIVPAGIVVHSTGADNPYLHRYLGPDDGIIGKNVYNNDWNRSGVEKCVHAFIGLTEAGNVAVYQTLPWDYRAWGVGTGTKGSYNASHIQFEVCESDTKDEDYFLKAWDAAQELCAYLCGQFGLLPSAIVDHSEAYQLGYASNHADISSWAKNFGKNMDDFRAGVSELLSSGTGTVVPETTESDKTPQFPLLKKGSKGISVRILQTALKLKGYSLSVDGDWGTDTEGAFRAFQTAAGLSVDGICGINSWAVLVS